VTFVRPSRREDDEVGYAQKARVISPAD